MNEDLAKILVCKTPASMADALRKAYEDGMKFGMEKVKVRAILQLRANPCED